MEPNQQTGVKPGSATGKKIGVLTSGGDAQGMNAALRAVARTALYAGAEPYAIYEGYQGMIDGGDGIRRFGWTDASGIFNRGGTVIGTFRSQEFMTRSGMLKAACNLVKLGIDRLVVIGGDGSLTGLDQFSQAWTSLLDELVDQGRITAEERADHPHLIYAGMVGSIDNDLVGTDMTIGVDSALHRIQSAIDAISSTAASHQRCFVVEVMGRHCGYLALASAISGGCDYVLIPEDPPADGWEDTMCDQLRKSRQAGRKDSIVIVAEGATNRAGDPISAEHVASAVTERLGEEARVTILGHVQRGGTPSAYDRWASTWLGYEATAHVLTHDDEGPGLVFGFQGEQIISVPLVKAVADTHQVPVLIAEGKYDEAMKLRGNEFHDLLQIFNQITNPPSTQSAPTAKRIGVMHAGALAPGMNTAARIAVWLGITQGYTPIGIHDGFVGLAEGKMDELTWKDVDGWAQEGGATLGTRRGVPTVEQLYAISRSLESESIAGLIVIGGWDAYATAQLIAAERSRYPGLQIPIICVPASIDNNLPGTTMAIGADAALNEVVDCVDKVKMSASASQRCFIIETMGRDCGYLALMGGFAGGAEQVYLNESGVTLDGLKDDIDWLKTSFDKRNRQLFLAVRNENANPNYTTEVLRRMFDQEGNGRYDTRTLIIGHIQQGDAPTPADRLLATRLTNVAVNRLIEQIIGADKQISCLGTTNNEVCLHDIDQAMKMADPRHQRPLEQWWLRLGDILSCVNRESSASTEAVSMGE
ncbi:MAG: 6-phosphofructokinase [Propionibacteriaceae bacterium]|jgi:6-phosphofructokinase 1|nr:6-phosphofructokinase [Propionibacteriaceae bacterium]